MDLAKTLSLSIVMVVGPQILTAVFLATSENWKKKSLAFIAGAGVSITIVTTLSYLLGVGAAGEGASKNTISYVILAFLFFSAVTTFLNRKKSKSPKWMSKLSQVQPRTAFKLGFILLGVFPSDILTSISVGGYFARNDQSWLHILPFISLVLLLLSLPALLVFTFGKRAEVFLPKVRTWMNENAWVVSEVVIGLFVVLVLSGLNS
jgi:threonine/homoserine/homoserine lactone efflux protein